MSKKDKAVEQYGLDILAGKTVPGFSDKLPLALPFKKDVIAEWRQQVGEAGKPGKAGFNMGAAAALQLAGCIKQQLFDDDGKRVPFLVSAQRDDPAYYWFRRGFGLLVPALNIRMRAEAFEEIPTLRPTDFAYHQRSKLCMTAQQIPKAPEHYFAELPSGTTEVVSFDIPEIQRHGFALDSLKLHVAAL